MVSLNDRDVKRVCILGYGREGQATYTFIKKHYPHLSICIADKQAVVSPPDEVQVFTGERYLDALKSCDCIIRSPGINLRDIPADPNKVTSATNIFFSRAQGKICGVTGTKGKSTTSALLAAMLSEYFPDVRYGGNIGKPMLPLLEADSPETIYVLELSSYQLEDLSCSPHVAVLLQIVPEHLDYHRTFDAYKAAKARITQYQKREDFLVFNSEFSVLSEIAASSAGQIKDTRSVSIDLSVSNLKGLGNLYNIKAASAAASCLGVPRSIQEQALKKFQPLEHRLEEVGVYQGVRFINDSLSTVPEALINAVTAFQGCLGTVIAGGYDRGIDQQILGQTLTSAEIDCLILFPTTGAAIKHHCLKAGYNGKIFEVTTMSEAVSLSFEHTPEGKVCLLSPAATSFNLFKDYRDRGEQFKNLVRSYRNQLNPKD